MGFKWSGVLFLIVACASTKSASGFRSTHVIVCRHWTHQCYHYAKQKCENGYEIIKHSETQRTGGTHGRFREYTLTVGCN